MVSRSNCPSFRGLLILPQRLPRRTCLQPRVSIAMWWRHCQYFSWTPAVHPTTTAPLQGHSAMPSKSPKRGSMREATSDEQLEAPPMSIPGHPLLLSTGITWSWRHAGLFCVRRDPSEEPYCPGCQLECSVMPQQPSALSC
ncbi:hypothetical protein MTO96_021756 [Rhipicephalus appendiculatus]